MIAANPLKTQVLIETDVRRKLRALDAILEDLLKGGSQEIPEHPGRDVQILNPKDLPPKVGLSTVEGQARLLHDLASIELQAIELGLRTLTEFPEAPRAFREQLAEITREEASHLSLCLKGLDDLERPWGTYATHDMLWMSAAADDSLLDRILVVHRYLEGSGLDASDKILRRLSGVPNSVAVHAVSVIRRDEVKHVRFGSRWYHELLAGADPAEDMRERLNRLFTRIPRRLEPISAEIRIGAGFLYNEIEVLEEFRGRWFKSEPIHQSKPKER
ncbi:MAG TPA: DUF455 family protein [Bdellovibrionales bacterium]|nr:DUF455 family protein [Bdellovibrionales bacterium]